MLFNSIEYLIFLPTVFILYWLLKSDYKKTEYLIVDIELCILWFLGLAFLITYNL